MAKAPKPYRRLVGGPLSGRRRQLWLGTDHLLAVSVLYGFEKYRRFFLRDIRAVIIRRTVAGTVRAGVCGAIGIGTVTGGYFLFRTSVTPADATAIFSYIIGGLGAVLLLIAIIDLLRGGTCAVYVQTVAGAERLDAPNRWRAARRVEAQLTPLIFAAQAEEAPPA